MLTNSLTINTGAGIDTLAFNESVSATTVSINLGDGNNQLDLAATKTLTASSFDLTTGTG